MANNRHNGVSNDPLSSKSLYQSKFLKTKSLLLGSLFLLTVLHAVSAFAGYQLEYYLIHGTTHGQVTSQIKSESPTGVFGNTKSTKKLKVTKTNGPNGCFYSQIEFSQNIVIRMPKWTNKSKAPSCLQRRFERAWINIMQHETKHRELFRQLESIVKKEISKLGTMPSCSLLDDRRKEVYAKLLKSNQQKHDHFHRTGPITYFDDCKPGES